MMSGGTLDFTRDYEIKPIGINGVGASVKANIGDTDAKSVTIIKGTEAYLTWDSQIAASCTCTCYAADGTTAINCGNLPTSSCGTGTGEKTQSTPFPIPGITQTTKFKVHCW